jgi:hypothetical protein
MILPGQLGGKVGRRRDLFKEPHANRMGLFVLYMDVRASRASHRKPGSTKADQRFFERGRDVLFDMV